ncbi:hypothetical protein GCM10010121_026810 [Streptomyces brasiliensis]|uniref:Regulatory protein n=2 Tax=Streptomyces brasiliensis TaxID=1954 RepID=A0A917NNZ0_9ACTN|nr:hypothetical protein GCM10010121_026810 [Streptomyces brasiliensis]
MPGKNEDPPEQPASLRLGAELHQIAHHLRMLARAQDRLHDLYEAVIDRDEDLSAVLQLIAETAKELVGARYAALGVLDEDGERLAQFIPVGMSEQEKADMADVDPPQGRGLLGHLIAHPEPHRLNDIAAHPDSAGFPPGHPQMRTLLGAAINIRNKTYGDLYVAERRDGHPFDSHDEALIVALASAAGLAIDDACLMRQTRLDAEYFQRMLLPQLPDLQPFDAAAIYHPATSPSHIGGDWYDALLVDHACAAVIGDVVGHDLKAAAAMAQTRNMLRALLYDLRATPSAVLTRLDQILTAVTDSPITTACLARIEPDRPTGWRLRWSTAGHLPPLLLPPGRPARYMEADPDVPLGVDPSLPRFEHTRPLPAGAVVILFTDGLVEHPRRSVGEGLERLAALASEHAALPLRALIQALVDNHPGDGHDDMAILALRTPH